MSFQRGRGTRREGPQHRLGWVTRASKPLITVRELGSPHPQVITPEGWLWPYSYPQSHSERKQHNVVGEERCLFNTCGMAFAFSIKTTCTHWHILGGETRRDSRCRGTWVVGDCIGEILFRQLTCSQGCAMKVEGVSIPPGIKSQRFHVTFLTIRSASSEDTQTPQTSPSPSV